MLKFLKRLFSKKDPELSITNHNWPEWLGPNPPDLIKDEITRQLQNQIEGTIVEQLQISAPLKSLTRAYPTTEDANRLLVRCAGIVVKFTALVHPPNDPSERLKGFFSWIAQGLDEDQRHDRIYLDLEMDAETAQDYLLLRIFDNESND